MTALAKYTLEGKTLKIVSDDMGDNPRSWDNMSVFYFSNHHNEDKSFEFKGPFEGIEEFLSKGMRQVIKHNGDVGVILPVYRYQHGDVVYSTKPFTNLPHARWDSGCIGFAVVTKAMIRETYGCKNMSNNVRAKAIEVLKGEVETFSNWANGDVFGFVVEDAEGEEIDSCYGFYGTDYIETILESGYLEKEWKTANLSE